MRPLLLRMRGFGAFRDETQVDFTDLELLGLVGNTGSGKSTVIDALTFALYGTVARYDDVRAVAPAINTLSNEAMVQLTFELGGQEYTAVRVARRTASGGATTKEARLERGGEVLADAARPMTEAVERLLGLDFARFTKVVVLPQGKFASFLHDKPKDRQDLLRQLLDLGIYERLGRQARETAKTTATQLEALEGQLQQQGVTDTQLAELNDVAVALAAARESLDDLLGSWVAAEQAQTTELALADGLGVLAIATSRVLMPAEVEQLGEELEAAAAAHASAAEALDTRHGEVDAARQQVAEGPDLVACNATLGQHQSLTRTRAEITQIDTDERAASAAAEEATAAADEARALVSAAQERVRAATAVHDHAVDAQAEGPNPTHLAHVGEQQRQLHELSNEMRDIQTAEAEAAGHVEKLQAELERTAVPLAEARATLDRVRSTKNAETLIESLQRGEPCPVCKQTVHDIPDHHLDVELAQATSSLETAKHAHAAAEQAAADAQRTLDQAQAHRQAVQRAVQDLELALENEPDSDALAALQETVRQRADAVAETLTERRAAGSALEQIQNEATVRDSLDGEAQAQETLRTLGAQRDAVARQHAELAEALADQPAEADVLALIALAEDLSAKQAAAEDARRSAQETVDTTSTALADLQGREQSARQQFGKVRDGLVALGAPEPQARSLVDDWTDLCRWAADRADALLAEHRQATETAADAQRALEKARTAALRVAQQHLPEPAEQPNLLAQQMLEAETRARTSYENAVQAVERAAAARQQVAELKETHEVHAMLGTLLKADGFERWIMDEVVAGLVDRASGRLFQLSNEQYSLEAEGMEFKVRDHRNGDERRDAKTLSGGETFLASLALALALADSLADMAPEGTPPLESLFLDEGFGTLDPETLDVVAGAIEELGASGRMVGIVTHIRELAERMPVRLEVRKGPTSSTVERVEA